MHNFKPLRVWIAIASYHANRLEERNTSFVVMCTCRKKHPVSLKTQKEAFIYFSLFSGRSCFVQFPTDLRFFLLFFFFAGSSSGAGAGAGTPISFLIF